MPTRSVTADKMQVGKKGSGKHWTAAEVAARQVAQEQAQRTKRVTLKPPAWVKESEAVLAVWKDVIKKLRGIELLDNIDSELLALYCDAIVQYRACSRRISMPVHREDGEEPAPIDEPIKAMQAWSRIVAMYADKLGLTPGGRARLAKRKAEKVLDPFAESFGG